MAESTCMIVLFWYEIFLAADYSQIIYNLHMK